MDFKKIKIVASDIDGTLLNEQKFVDEKTIEAIKKLKEKKIMFGLCTGREPQTAESLSKKWNIFQYLDFIIGYNGGEIIDYSLDRNDIVGRLDHNVIKVLVDHFKDMDLNIGIPEKGCIYFQKEDRHSKKLSLFDAMEQKIVDFDKYLTSPKAKVMISTDDDNVENVLKRASEFDCEKYNVNAYKTTKFMVEISDKNVCKSNGLKKLLENHNLSSENLLVFGDADNDYDMVKFAGIGVVMKNGYERTKKVANFITEKDNNNDGIADFLNKHLFNI